MYVVREYERVQLSRNPGFNEARLPKEAGFSA